MRTLEDAQTDSNFRQGQECSHNMANNLGKVYICGKCGSQVIVTKGGTGALKCCGGPMEQKK
jgi:desulfoferrodoxin-like iron-binding protein